VIAVKNFWHTQPVHSASNILPANPAAETIAPRGDLRLACKHAAHSNSVGTSAFINRLKPAFLIKEGPLDIRRLASIYIDIPSMRPGTVGAYALAVFSAFVATVLHLALAPYVAGSQYITFHPAIVSTTLISGFGAGVLCGLLSFAAVVLLIARLIWRASLCSCW
jgi:hypothetical protein